MDAAPADAADARCGRRDARSLVLSLLFMTVVVTPLSLLLREVEFSHHQRVFRVGHAPPIDSHPCTAPGTHACVRTLLEMGNSVETGGSLYPEAIFREDWSKHVAQDDVLHLGTLQRACTTFLDSVIPWQFGVARANDLGSLLNETASDDEMLAALGDCPALDVYIPSGLRGEGYCEDAAAYTKYLHARMLPHWVLERRFFDKTDNSTLAYHDLCPLTPLLVLNHYWGGLRERISWPTTKPLYLMPNIEMFELDALHLWQADVILCKTAICAHYISKWFAQQGNPRLTRVIYTRHTSSDVATNALAASGSTHEWGKRPKNFETPVFVHTAGSSTQKGTAHVFNCWLSRPDLPQLDVYIDPTLYGSLFEKNFDTALSQSTNIKLHFRRLDAVEFGSMIAAAAFFLCTSNMEGYGHYINHARAAGGLIVTPDVPPMNELIDAASGVLMEAERVSRQGQFLGGTSRNGLGLRNVTGFVSRFRGTHVCDAVDRAMKDTNVTERHRRAWRARQQYLFDTAFFAMKMSELRRALLPSAS